MDPANMPTWGSTPDAQGMLNESFNNLGPLATSYHGAQTGATINPITNQTSTQPQGIGQFTAFLGGVANQTGHIAFDAAKWLGEQGLNLATAPERFGASIGQGILDHLSLGAIQQQNQQQSARMDTLNQQFKSGLISKSQYQSGLSSLMQDQANLSNQETALLHRLPADQTNAIQSAIDTASTLVTVLTAGFGNAYATGVTATGLEPLAAKTTADYLVSTSANVYLDSVEAGLSKIAENPELFAKLSPMAQRVFQTGVAEVMTQGQRMSAGQIARASAANLALKYPIYYQMLSSTGRQLYDQLDQKQYGDAVRTVAFNAALLLSGGPIGWALDHGGKLAGGLVARTFARTAFLDELSRGIGNGDAAGLFNAINSITDPAVKADVIRNLSAVEATNVAAVGGDAQAAAWRVIKGMAAYEGTSLRDFTHEEALQNMVTFAKAQRLADATAKSLGMGPVTVGRVDARVLNTIRSFLTKGDLQLAESGLAPTATDAVDMSKAPDFLQPQGSQVEKIANATGVARQAGASDEQIKNILEQGVGSNRSESLRVLEQNQDHLSSSDRLALTGGDTGQAGMQMASSDRNALLAKFRAQAAQSASTTATDPISQRLQLWEDWKAQNMTQAAAHNENFDRQMKALIQKYGDDPTMLDSAIAQIKASFQVKGFPEAVTKQLAKLGYLPITPVDLEAPFKEGTGKLTTSLVKSSDNFFTKAVQPLPVLGFLGDTLTRLGLSPNAATQRVYQVFNDNLARNLTESGALPKLVGEDASQTSDTLIKQLSSYAHNPTRSGLLNRTPISDLRMLTTKDIQAAAHVTSEQAVQIQQAITRAYLQVPLALRGLGDRAADLLYTGPQAGLARRYLRLQGALRFAWNPFFSYLRVAPKTEMLTEAEGGGVLSSIFTGQASQLNTVRGLLRDSGAFDTAGIRGLGADAASLDPILAQTATAETTASGAATRNISKHLLPIQEQSIAGLVNAQAERMGMSAKDYIQAYPQQVRDTVQAIAQYDRRGNFINSPLARTLNVAFFPFRFETKVATVFAQSLARSSLMTQVAVIHGVMQAHSWLNTPEGAAWYAQNSDALGVFNYITPLSSMAEAVQSLLPGQDHSLGNFGELGGLPFGWIPQLLDAEGLTHFNQTAIDPSTGNAIPEYVPATLRGQAAVAIQDFLGSLFSYPGATVGLPSKTSLTRGAGLYLAGASKTTDLQQVTPALSQSQQSYQQLLQQAAATNPALTPGKQQQPPTVPSQTVPGLKVPAQDSPLLHPTPKPGSGSRKLKKGQFTPALLPGQTQIGQL